MSLSAPLELCIFRISATKLPQLKSAASAPNQSDEWISTNDALCALLWRQITRARTHAVYTANFGSLCPETPLNCCLALEARRRMVPALPEGYLGNAIFHCRINSDLGTVTSSSVPLHTIAKLFREAVTRYDSAKIHGVIGVIDSMARATDQLEWGGGLGKAESVRLPGINASRRNACLWKL